MLIAGLMSLMGAKMTLFDQFWEAYPKRNNKKVGKRQCLEKFKKKKYAPETVQLMVDWIRQDIDNREAVKAKGKFYADPCNPIVFLNQYRWEDEIGVVINDTVRREGHRSKGVYSMNVKSAIGQFKDIVGHRTKAELRDNPGFMSAYGTYPEFREWAGKQAFKADSIAVAEKITKAVALLGPPPLKPKKPDIVVPAKVDPVADLPPPGKIDKIMEFVGDVKQAKADGRIENIVRGSGLF